MVLTRARLERILTNRCLTATIDLPATGRTSGAKQVAHTPALLNLKTAVDRLVVSITS